MLETIAQYREAHEAYLAKGALAAAGIEAVIRDEHVVGVNWLYSDAVGGVKLAVESDLVQQAADVLKPQTIDRGISDRSITHIHPCRIIGILAILVMAGMFIPMLIVGIPLIVFNRRRHGV
jgi:hypothetical protein